MDYRKWHFTLHQLKCHKHFKLPKAEKKETNRIVEIKQLH